MVAERNEKVAERVREIMGSEYKVESIEITKNNGVILAGIAIRKPGSKISPVIYLDGFHGSIESIAQQLVHEYENEAGKIELGIPDFFSKDYILQNVQYQMVGVDANREWLKQRPHKVVLDMAAVYRVCLKFPGPEGLNGWFVLTDFIMESSEITQDELDDAAIRNMVEAGIHFESIETVILTGDYGKEKTIEECDMEGGDLYVLFNKSGMYGSGLLMVKRLFEKIAESAGRDLIILPSSVHELLLLKDYGIVEADDLKNMVRAVNCSEVPPQEVLTDNAYRYVRDTGEIEFV